jgi:hypothetical protein
MSGLVTVRYWRAPARMRYVFASSMVAPSPESFPFASIGLATGLHEAMPAQSRMVLEQGQRDRDEPVRTMSSTYSRR